MRNSITPFQSEPRRAASRRHHSRFLAAELLAVAEFMMPSRRRCSRLDGCGDAAAWAAHHLRKSNNAARLGALSPKAERPPTVERTRSKPSVGRPPTARRLGCERRLLDRKANLSQGVGCLDPRQQRIRIFGDHATSHLCALMLALAMSCYRMKGEFDRGAHAPIF